MRYLVINNDVIVNVALWDGVSEWNPGEGLTVELAEEGVVYYIGSTRIDGQWVAPAEPDPDAIN